MKSKIHEFQQLKIKIMSKNQTTKKLIAFIIMMMFSFTFVNAQTCSGNKILVYKCINGNCHSKCVNPNNIPSGWSTWGCVGCGGGGGGCNCSIRPIPPACAPTCGWRISSSENDSPFITSIVPNPVSNSAIISFTIPQSQNISLKVFDVSGRLVSILADRTFEEGENELVWNAEEVNAGVYFLRMETTSYSENLKLIVTK